MDKNGYIKHIKNLLKTYHPDLCTDGKLIDTYNEITIRLNITLNKLEGKETDAIETLLED